MHASDSHAAIEAVWRLESPKLIAGLMRLVRDLGAAEDLAHDALVAALEQWPREGVPRNPAAWITTGAPVPPGAAGDLVPAPRAEIRPAADRHGATTWSP